MSIPIEDGPADIVRKAITGYALRDHSLESGAGVSEVELSEFKAGRLTPESTRRIAPHLGLDANKLLALATGYPPAPAAPPGLLAVTLPCPSASWPDMTVNAYAIHAPGERDCIVVDTGDSPEALIAAIRAAGLRPVAVALTHGHFDHVGGLAGLRAAFGPLAAYAHPADNVAETVAAHTGHTVTAGALTLTARATPGHSEGGLTWVTRGPYAPVAFTGDALFAGSVGGAPRRLAAALTAAREILSLPEDTVLAPGHGPLTTVGTEKRHNPFF